MNMVKNNRKDEIKKGGSEIDDNEESVNFE